MRRDEFQRWLAETRGITANAINTRSSSVQRIERAMERLGSPFSDLDKAYDSDRLVELRKTITELRQDAVAGGRRYEVLLPKSEKPLGRLSNFAAWLGQYAQFRAGEAATEIALEEMRTIFLQRMGGFETFEQHEGRYWEGERAYKDDMLAKAAAAVRQPGLDDAGLGKAIYDILLPHNGAPLRWQTTDAIEKAHPPETLRRLWAILGALARSGEPVEQAVMFAIRNMEGLRDAGVSQLTQGEIAGIAFGIAAAVRPADSAFFRIAKAREFSERLALPVQFQATPIASSDVHAWLSLLHRVFDVMRDRWRWHPRDLLDVQGFAWVVLSDGWATEDDEREPDTEDDNDLKLEVVNVVPKPTNLILYGPPGTGKTYATAEEALRLCGSNIPPDRNQLMAEYQRLRDAEQIEFVTFHQSMSYEDFIEGLRPVRKEGSVGFELQPVPGVLRRLAEKAAQAGSSTFRVGNRSVFKMSIGEVAKTSEAHLFDEAIKGGYTTIGWGEIDWTDPKFDDRQAILEACRQSDDPEQAKATAQSGYVTMSAKFRNDMKIGDIVVVSKGNQLIRAIGEVTGEYQFRPRPEGGYAHRRDVKWLWVDRDGVDADSIYDREIVQGAIYRLDSDVLKVLELERLVATQQDHDEAPRQFVLIIDEVNRANISKVFGELITLLEPDKRLGQRNAITLSLPYSGDTFGIPSNLHVVGTMNTADRSIALLDTALRRRFEFREMHPRPDLLRTIDGIDLGKLLQTLNERIEYLFDREHQIGHAYFMSCETRGDLDEVMRRKIIPLLAEYFFDDWMKVASALGDSGEDGKPTGFLERKRLVPPRSFAENEDRFRWSVRAEFDYAGLQ